MAAQGKINLTTRERVEQFQVFVVVAMGQQYAASMVRPVPASVFKPRQTLFGKGCLQELTSRGIEPDRGIHADKAKLTIIPVKIISFARPGRAHLIGPTLS